MTIAQYIGTDEARQAFVEHAVTLYAQMILDNQEAVRADTPLAEIWFECAMAWRAIETPKPQ